MCIVLATWILKLMAPPTNPLDPVWILGLPGDHPPVVFRLDDQEALWGQGDVIDLGQIAPPVGEYQIMRNSREQPFQGAAHLRFPFPTTLPGR